MDSNIMENIVDQDFLQVYFAIADAANLVCPAHWHNHMEVLLILEGSMTAYVNSQNYHLGVHDLLLINTNDIHSTHIQGYARYILLQIPAAFLARSLPDFSRFKVQEFYANSDSLSSAETELREHLMNLKALYEQKEDGYQLAFMAVLYQFLHKLYQSFRVTCESSTSVSSRDTQRIESVIRYVQLHYQTTISLEEIAGFVCLSREYFCRLFKEHTGQTFLEYLNTYRIVQFYNDLLQSSESVTNLLARHGITNYKVFSRNFRAMYHDTPSHIRAQEHVRRKR